MYAFHEVVGGKLSVPLTLNHLDTLVHRLLSRRERNNGHGRALISSVSLRGRTRYILKDGYSGFEVRPSHTPEHFELYLFGERTVLLDRLNAPSRSALAFQESREVAKERRRLKALGLYEKPTRRKRRALADTNKMHHHFKNHVLSWDDAVKIVAKAAKRSVEGTRKKLLSTLDEQGVASLRLSSGFVFRIDLGYEYQGLLDIYERVELRSSKDNGSLAYRRLRALLKQHFNCERRARKEAQIIYLAQKREEKLLRRFY